LPFVSRCILLQFSNPFLNEVGVKLLPASKLWGKVSEFAFMFAMPFFFVRLGVKNAGHGYAGLGITLFYFSRLVMLKIIIGC